MTLKRRDLSKFQKIDSEETFVFYIYGMKIHIESQFLEGMSWSNYGQWHVEHIFPISKFENNTPIRIINALSNLQPLWAKDSLSKNNKII